MSVMCQMLMMLLAYTLIFEDGKDPDEYLYLPEELMAVFSRVKPNTPYWLYYF